MTLAQLHAAGLDAKGVWVRVRAGRLFPMHHRVYAVGRPARTPLERASAAVLACGPGAALSHEAALAIWGITSRWPPSFDVAVVHDRRPRGITVHRLAGLTKDDVRIQHGIPHHQPRPRPP